ncbi:MAG: tRNA pseudouridine(55) synthase TruB [Thiotrichales bacterium]|nr:tRNA pseudouridine(55) synthase TruB [Thiotrichales bacterium]
MTKKQWQRVDGIVLIDKPEGMTSNDLLQKVRRIYQAKKAGHTGALDPFATGLLPICFGEATKISGLLLDSDKRYQATLKLGVATDTGDKDGEEAQEEAIPELSQEKIETVLHSFIGEVAQVPPMYSALKHKGKPLYEYARQGIEIDRPARNIQVLEIKLLGFEADEIRFEVFCSKGTYVRTLGEDIAKALGTVGHLTALRRLQTGSLTADDMHTMEVASETPQDYLKALDLPLEHLQAMHLNEQDTQTIQHGGKLAVEKPQTDLVRFYDDKGRFFGVGEWQYEKNLLKPKRLFNLADD